MHVFKGLALPRVNHSGEIAPGGCTSPACHACGSTGPVRARCCHRNQDWLNNPLHVIVAGAYTLMEPELFIRLGVPNPLEVQPAAGETGFGSGEVEPMLPLPPEFSTSLRSKQDALARLRTKVMGAGLTERAKGDLQTAIQAHFKVRARGA